MKRVIEALSESTPISLGLVIVFFGGIIWFTRVAALTESTALTLDELSGEVSIFKTETKNYLNHSNDRLYDKLVIIESRLSRIEARLDVEKK